MKAHVRRSEILATLGLVVAFLASACGGSDSTATVPPTSDPIMQTPVPGVEQTATQSASYRVELWTGPALTVTMSFPTMSVMDQGQPVNRHLEIHIFDKNSGAKVTEMIPTVNITDQATGASRELADVQETGASLGVSFVSACLISKHREGEPHFGDNIYLPDGTYSITVAVGDETAVVQLSL